MSGTYTSDEKVEYALKTALFRTMQSKDQPAENELSAPPRIFPKNIMKKNLIEKGEGDIDEDGYYVGGTGSNYGSNQLANLEEPELTITNYRIIDPTSNKITNKRVSDMTTVNMSQISHNDINALPTTGTTYPLKNWFFRGHYGSHSGEAAFNAANSSYDGLQLAWDKSAVGDTATEADIVPHLKFYLQVQTTFTNVQHGDNITYGHDLMKGLIGLDQNFSTTIQVVQGQGGNCATLSGTGTSTGDYWFTQATSGTLSFYGVTTKVNANNGLSNLATTKFPMISFIRYTGETGFGAGSGGGSSVELVSADPNVTNMIGGTAQTMTTTSFEFDGNVNITGDLSVTGSGAGTFKGVQSDSNNNILISGNETWNGNTTGLYNTTLGWAAGYQMSSGGSNTLIGHNAGRDITTGTANTALGTGALLKCTTGAYNIAIGHNSMNNNIGNDGYMIAIGPSAMQYYGKDAGTSTNRYDIAIGYQAMLGQNGSSGGEYNVAIGTQAMRQITTGHSNVSIGRQAGYNISTGYYNTSIGYEAGHGISSGQSNTCLGYKAGYSSSTGVYNVFIGKDAGITCTASQNVVIGHQAGYSGTSRSNCVFVGNQAGYDWNSNNQVGIGYRAIHHKKGDKNVAVGYNCMGDSSPDGIYAEMNTAIGAEALHKLNGNSSGNGSYNVAVGHRAGYALTTASKNILIGDQAGAVLTTTWGNIIIGYQNGYQLKSGSGSNVLIGMNNITASGNSTAYYCHCIGYNAGRSLSTGYKNDLIGFNCGYTISTGHNNCGYGAETLRLLTTGEYNACFGSYSGYNMTTGNTNTCIGPQAGYNLKAGDSNTCIGHNAGYYEQNCSRSIFIGRHAGCASNKGTGTDYGEGGKNDQLFINTYMSGNTYTGTNQFIYGYMKMDDNPFITFNCDVGIGYTSPKARLHVEGGHLLITEGNKSRDETGGCIQFHSIENGSDGSTMWSQDYAHSLIADVKYATDSVNDKSEMLFFKGNNKDGSYGPDRFHFVGAADFRITLGAPGDATGKHGHEAARQHSTWANGEDATFIIKNNGNVGIGTTSPNCKLSLGTSQGSIAVYENGGNYFYGFKVANVGSGWGLNFLTSTGDDSDSNIRMCIKRDNGNVGIGTTSPSEKLNVVGHVRISEGIKLRPGESAYDYASFSPIYWGDQPNHYYIQPIMYNETTLHQTKNYTKLRIMWHTGIWLGAHSNYGGVSFWDDACESDGTALDATKVAAIGDGDKCSLWLGNARNSRTYQGLFCWGGHHIDIYSSSDRKAPQSTTNGTNCYINHYAHNSTSGIFTAFGGPVSAGYSGGDNGAASSGRKVLHIGATYNKTGFSWGWWLGGQNENWSSGDGDLYFHVCRGSTTGHDAGYVQDAHSGVLMNFTGQHRTFVKDIPHKKTEPYVGLIVSANQNKYIKMGDKKMGGVETGNKAITISEALPVVALTTKEKDKSCFGVICDVEDEERREFGANFTSVYQKEKGDTRTFINSLGEGGIWVTDKNGNLESGDYITSSIIPGYGQKQDSEFLANYTVAKITMDCDFNPQQQKVKKIKRHDVKVTYYKSVIPKEDAKREWHDKPTPHHDYKEDDDEWVSIMSENDYNNLKDEEWEGDWEAPTKSCYTAFEKDELENDMDENNEFMWEDTDEYEYAYNLRYLLEDGTQITKQEYETKKANNESVYIAAFVGCTYHCG